MVDTNPENSYLQAVTASRETAGPPVAPAAGVSAVRAALYVDGFNLYHAIDDIGKDHLKWVSLWKLGELIIPTQSQRLVKVVYCSAIKPGDPAKMKRHQEYVNALRHSGVTVMLGHFIADSVECHDCKRTWYAPKEKESDVNLALAMLQGNRLNG